MTNYVDCTECKHCEVEDIWGEWYCPITHNMEFDDVEHLPIAKCDKFQNK